jgi:hypothetical protein
MTKHSHLQSTTPLTQLTPHLPTLTVLVDDKHTPTCNTTPSSSLSTTMKSDHVKASAGAKSMCPADEIQRIINIQRIYATDVWVGRIRVWKVAVCTSQGIYGPGVSYWGNMSC